MTCRRLAAISRDWLRHFAVEISAARRIQRAWKQFHTIVTFDCIHDIFEFNNAVHWQNPRSHIFQLFSDQEQQDGLIDLSRVSVRRWNTCAHVWNNLCHGWTISDNVHVHYIPKMGELIRRIRISSALPNIAKVQLLGNGNSNFGTWTFDRLVRKSTVSVCANEKCL